jgi:hypothetical protein
MTMTAWSEFEPVRSSRKTADGPFVLGERDLSVASPTVAAVCWDAIRSQPLADRSTVIPTGVDAPNV